MKKFTVLLLCFLAIITCGLAGCATFSIDKVKFYNDVVAKLGDKNFTRFELMEAYESYGYQLYVSQKGQSEEQALQSTLDYLVDSEALYLSIKDDNTYKPTAYQVNEIVKSLFSSFDSTLDTYVEKATKILNVELQDATQSESIVQKTSTTRNEFDFASSRRATIVKDGDTYKIQYVKSEDENLITSYEKYIDSAYLEDFNKAGIAKEIKDKYLANLKNKLNSRNYIIKSTEIKLEKDVLFNKVIELFAEQLKDYEYYLRDANNQPYSTKTDELIERAISREFTSSIKSQHIKNLRNRYLKDEKLSINELKTEFVDLVTASYEKYKEDESTYKTNMKEIGSKGDTIFYHPTNLEDNTKFGYFTHTLLGFSETQKTKIKNLNYNPEEDDGTVDKKSTYENIVLTETEIPYRNSEGVEVGKTTVANVLKEYKDIFNMPNSTEAEYQAKLSAFIDFTLKYSSDPGSLTAGMPYVVGTNGFSGMEENFTKEAIKLMNTETSGAMSTVDFEGTTTDGMCITPYGIHLIFYVGNVNAYDVNYDEIELMQFEDTVIEDEEDAQDELLNLTTKVLNPLTGETYFDMLFDKVYPADSSSFYTSNTGYSTTELLLIRDAKADLGYTTYDKVIKSTLSK